MCVDQKKKNAAKAALPLVESGMRLGLGTGSTAEQFIALLAQRVKEDFLDIICLPSSERTRIYAAALGVPLFEKAPESRLDLVVDGADEIDSCLRLIKGGGGALLREKIVASSADFRVIIADDAKRVKALGCFPLPIEIIPFGAQMTLLAITAFLSDHDVKHSLKPRFCDDGKRFETDEGNWIWDCCFLGSDLEKKKGPLSAPEAISEGLTRIPGVVCNGLFIDLYDEAYIASETAVFCFRRSQSGVDIKEL